ncbi:hypothetical protein Daus18300_014059 [Diaporthe australafricana]|uniref:Peptidase S8/S53 domain-containing protein n=1 Tax=Diaporthe australafricana TaxID=127596 RepID=A0ABR3VWN5_9PEZI
MTSMHSDLDSDGDDVVGEELSEAARFQKPTDEISSRFHKDIEEARDLVSQLENLDSKDERDKAQDQYVERHLPEWRETTKDGRNFLHVLACSEDRPGKCLQMIMARAIRKMREEMGAMDKKKQTPLTLALLNDNFVFIHATCKNLSAKTQKLIGEKLKSECEEQESEHPTTCLHEAIHRGQNHELIKIIIGFAPVAMFSVRDSRGRTPIHLAVEYDRCSAAQVDIVRELLRRGPAAMNVRMSNQTNSSTVYQYHEKTRREANEKMSLMPPAIQSREPAQEGRNEHKEAEFGWSRLTSMEAAKSRIAQDTVEICPPPDQPVKPGNLISVPGASIPSGTGTDSGKRLDQRRGSQNALIEPQQSVDLPQSGVGNMDDDQGRVSSSDEIRELLKLFYLRKKRPQEAVAHLHVQNQRDKELWFDFGQQRMAKTTPKSFGKLFDHLVFDKALHYVSLPQFEPTIVNSSQREQLEKRWCLLFVFHWLKKRGVNRIITVEVDDMEAAGHDDECMEEFASHYRQIKCVKEKQSDVSLNPITVALIDDGADITHPELKDNNFPGKSFDHYKDRWRVAPFWESASGHGTLMARLIHRICPSATIHIIKLKTVQTADSAKLQIDPLSATQAIEYATELGAQIISMSWAIDPPDKEADKRAFKDAITKARNQNILMFCSAIDQGNFEDPKYPHASNGDCIFKIGAATAMGTVPDYVSNEGLSFIFPGHDVVLRSPFEDISDRRFGEFASHTGSSVATALASGLAALVLECVRLGHINSVKIRDRAIKSGETGKPKPLAIQRADIDKIRERVALKYAFFSICVGHQVENRYIEVWKTFSKFAADLKENEGLPDFQLSTITSQAEWFLGKKIT